MEHRHLEWKRIVRRLSVVTCAFLVWTLASAGGPRTVSLASSGQAAAPTGGPAIRMVAQQVSKDIYQGWKWWHVYCYRCHGTDANSNPALPGPDLKNSIKVLSREDFLKTIHEGRLPKGMPAWGQLLTDQQIAQLYAYVQARADGSLKPGRPDEQ